MKSVILALLGVLLAASGCGSSPVRDTPPTIGGQPVPNQNIILDFSKRYTLTCLVNGKDLILPRCRILGYTGDAVRDASGKMSYEFGEFGRWLVVEDEEGMKIVLPPRIVVYLTESIQLNR